MLRRKQLNQAFKNRYKDKIIHQSSDPFGQIQVIDEGLVRSLHFDAIEKQSAMSLENPEKLILSYTVFMMAGFLFNPKSRDILCIGLGGGSIPRYLSHNLKDCKMDVVEIRQQVIDIAHQFFRLPEGPKINYYQGDGAAFVRQSKPANYHMVLVDAYDHIGVSDAVTNEQFARSCAASLTPEGVFCINLWSHPSSVFQEALQGIRSQFTDAFVIPVKDRTNQIVLAAKPGALRPSLQLLKKRCRVLEETMKLPFSSILAIMQKHNADLFRP